MNRASITIASITASAGILVSGCENMTPGQNAAAFGGAAALLGGSIARAAGASTGEAIAIGAVAGAVVAATAYVIAKHKATERQRRLAEQRARVYYGRMSAQKKATMKQKKVRYIAVKTEANEKTTRGATPVMIWDTQSQTIVGNNVYDVEKTPAVGSTARFETHSAQYVGTGG